MHVEDETNTLDPPNLVALLIADRVIEETNHKKGIIGTFTTFNTSEFPAMFPPWYIYGAVTNLIPDKLYSFSIALAHEESQHVLFSFAGEFVVPNRTAVPEFSAPVSVGFPKEGNYVVRFCVGGKTIGTRILEVNLRPPTGGASPAEGGKEE